MAELPKLFDHSLLALRERRIRHDALFLHDLVIDEIKDRLASVNKAFHDPLVITRHDDYWAEQLGLPTKRFAENLELAEQAHDLVIHAMALHWANDPIGQLIQMRRALRPDGLMLVACFGGETLTQLRQVMGSVEMAQLGGLSPRIAPMGDLRDLGNLLGRAGFALPVSDRILQNVSYANIHGLIKDLREMGEANAMYDRHKAVLSKRFMNDLLAQYPRNADGKIIAEFDIMMLAGWAPDPSQQQPLKPGSATHSLAEALNAAELSNETD